MLLIRAIVVITAVTGESPKVLLYYMLLIVYAMLLLAAIQRIHSHVAMIVVDSSSFHVMITMKLLCCWEGGAVEHR